MSNWFEQTDQDVSEVLRSYEHAPDEPYADPEDEPEETE